MKAVRCIACGWIGREEDLGYETLNDPGIEYCPSCKDSEHLVDVDSECELDDKELTKLWQMFGDVSVNNMDQIEEEFLGFPEGTEKEEVWQWFDERYSGGVVKLMAGGE